MSSLMGGKGGDTSGAAQQQAEEERKAAMRAQINGLFDAPDAKQRFGQEESQLSDTLRNYYSDELKRGYGESERALRFGAADSGNVGGSAYADQTAKLNEQNALGGTRIQEAVQRAVNNLRSQREDTRLRSINLVNAGSGDDAVAAASSGLKGAIDNANAGNRENLFPDLFNNLAFTKVIGDNNSRNAQAAARLQSQVGAFFPTQPSSGGTVVRTTF